MPVKRRNHGRQKTNRGATNNIQCDKCGRIVAKDKAISRSSRSPLIENASLDDLRVATVYDDPGVPTVHLIENYCVSCACHLRIVGSRCVIYRKDRDHRRVRENPVPQ